MARYIDANSAHNLGTINAVPVISSLQQLVIKNFNSTDWGLAGYQQTDNVVNINIGKYNKVSVYYTNNEIDIYLGGLTPHVTKFPSIVIKGNMSDAGGDNISLTNMWGTAHLLTTEGGPSLVGANFVADFHNFL